MSAETCQLELKTLKGKQIILQDISVETTVEELYHRVHEVETTPNGKWKLVIVTTSLKTLKWNEKEKKLNEYGVEPCGTYRVEVVLDMGAYHGSLCRQ